MPSLCYDGLWNLTETLPIDWGLFSFTTDKYGGFFVEQQTIFLGQKTSLILVQYHFYSSFKTCICELYPGVRHFWFIFYFFVEEPQYLKLYVLLCSNLVVGVGFRYLHVLALKMIKREGFFYSTFRNTYSVLQFFELKWNVIEKWFSMLFSMSHVRTKSTVWLKLRVGSFTRQLSLNHK